MKPLILLIVSLALVLPTLHQTQLNRSDGEVLNAHSSQYDRVWKGHLGKDIPVFIHYHQLPESQLLEGEITYLNTKAKMPISLTGKIKQSGAVHLTEYNPEGYVSGVIDATIKGDSLTGKWHSPGTPTPKTFALRLHQSDSLIPTESSAVKPQNIFGKYHYQYGEKGYEGNLEFRKINAHQAVLSLFSVTSVPARNIADGVDNDTISLPVKTNFIHKVYDKGSCKVELQFFKNFVRVTYPKEADCKNTFGMNATYEGTYYKIDQ